MCKAKIVDFYSIKSFHEIFNISLILMCSEIFSRVEVILGKTAYENLLLLSQNNAINIPSNLSIRVRSVYEKDNQWGALIRTFMGGFRVLVAYLFLSKDTTLILNYCNVFAFPFMLFLNRFLRKKLLITCHGELELLLASSLQKYKPSFWYTIIYKWSFLYLVHKSNAKILVLGTSIKNNLLKLYPRIKNNVININHPYLFTEKELIKDENGKKNIPLIIGVLGHLNEYKGLSNFLYLGECFKKEIAEGRLILKSIGKLPDNLEIGKYSNILWGGKDVLTRNEFEKQVSQLDYVLYLYPQQSYKLTASGAVLDAVRFLKPIIYLKNDYLCSITKGFKVGFEGATMEELVCVINNELKNKTPITSFRIDLLKMRNMFSVSYNVQLFKSGLNA